VKIQHQQQCIEPFMTNRTVFFVSDGTGITAETFGNAILAQFEMEPRHVRLPFIDSMDWPASRC
jgi:regulator of PEP synthase PpsR (kinase-PPPase family)